MTLGKFRPFLSPSRVVASVGEVKVQADIHRKTASARDLDVLAIVHKRTWLVFLLENIVNIPEVGANRKLARSGRNQTGGISFD